MIYNQSMDVNDVSPKYMMQLIPKIETVLWSMFESSKYQNVRRYVDKWHEEYWNGNFSDGENFQIFFRDEGGREIDLSETLHKMPKEMVIKMAIDLGIDTPGFLPVVPQFKNVLKDQNQSAYQNFERATKNVYGNPDEAVALSFSTLEGIIKTILNHDTFKNNNEITKKTLGKLVAGIIKVFGFDGDSAPSEIKTIASQLRGIGKTIEDLRSDKTTAHGKSHDEYVIDDPLWASMIVNTSATFGMFLWEYFNAKYLPKLTNIEDENIMDDTPIDLSEIPF